MKNIKKKKKKKSLSIPFPSMQGWDMSLKFFENCSEKFRPDSLWIFWTFRLQIHDVVIQSSRQN